MPRPHHSLPQRPHRPPSSIGLVIDSPAADASQREGESDARPPASVAVDDEPAVLAAVSRDLRRGFGERYRVMRAPSGAEGLELLAAVRARGGQAALLVADPR